MKKMPKLIDMMSQLIATPSVSSAHANIDLSNEPVIDRLANWLDGAGFSVRKQPVSEQKYNMIATIGGGSNGLVLSGHSDTVPCDEALWQSDPFTLSERDGLLYGLGSCDMKSFLAMAIQASTAFDFAKAAHPLTIVATADEETTMAGARLLAEDENPLGKFCVIGEPTDLTPIREHKGIIMEAIKFNGQSGHSSNPALGHSALEGMHEFIQALMEYRTRLQQQFHNSAFEVAEPTLNLGHIHGGDNPNRICGECELHIDLRFLPGMQIAELRDEIRQLARRVASRRELDVSFIALLNGVPAMHTGSDSDLNEFLQQVTQRQSQSVAFGTEAPFYNAMGTETIVIGPGSINQAHQPDEFLPVAQIEPTINLLKNLIQRYCFT